MTCRIPRLGEWHRIGGATFPPAADDIPPTVLVSTLEVAPVNGSYLVTFTFSEPVYGLILGEIVVGNGTASLLTGSDGDAVWGATITPTASGNVSVTIPAGVCQDAFGNLNLVSNTLNTYAVLWLLLDRYVTNRGAGTVNGTAAEPGPGNRTTNEVDGTILIDASELESTAPATPNYGDLRLHHGQVIAFGQGVMWAMKARKLTAGSYIPYLCKTLMAGGTPISAYFFSMTDSLIQVFSRTDGAASLGGNSASNAVGDWHDLKIIGRPSGHAFVLIDNALHRAYSTPNTMGTPYWQHDFYSGTSNADDTRITEINETDATLYPIPTLSDTFNDGAAPYTSDGLAHIEASGGSGVAWSDTSGQWSNSANKAYINATAILSAEGLLNPSFATWTGDNPNSWTIVNETAPDPEVTQRDSGQNHAGTNLVGGSANFFATASAGNPRANQAAMATQHLIYRIVAVVSIRTTGSALINVGGGANDPGAAGTYTLVRRATASSSFQIQGGAGAALDITFDSVSIKQLTFANTLRVASPASTSEPLLRAALTITSNTLSGVVINLDDGATPANCIHVWYDRLNGRIFARQLIAGVWQADSLNVVTTYSAGARLEVRRIGNSVYVFYNDMYVGNFTTTVSNANTKVALFATDDASYIQNVECYPTNGYDYSYYV